MWSLSIKFLHRRCLFEHLSLRMGSHLIVILHRWLSAVRYHFEWLRGVRYHFEWLRGVRYHFEWLSGMRLRWYHFKWLSGMRLRWYHLKRLSHGVRSLLVVILHRWLSAVRYNFEWLSGMRLRLCHLKRLSHGVRSLFMMVFNHRLCGVRYYFERLSGVMFRGLYFKRLHDMRLSGCHFKSLSHSMGSLLMMVVDDVITIHLWSDAVMVSSHHLRSLLIA